MWLPVLCCESLQAILHSPVVQHMPDVEFLGVNAERLNVEPLEYMNISVMNHEEYDIMSRWIYYSELACLISTGMC